MIHVYMANLIAVSQCHQTLTILHVLGFYWNSNFSWINFFLLNTILFFVIPNFLNPNNKLFIYIPPNSIYFSLYVVLTLLHILRFDNIYIFSGDYFYFKIRAHPFYLLLSLRVCYIGLEKHITIYTTCI